MMKERFQYWKPNTITDWWKPRAFLGCDEFHNKSVAVIVPLIGGFVLFWERRLNHTVEHVYAYSRSWEGFVDPTCSICREIKADL